LNAIIIDMKYVVDFKWMERERRMNE